VEGAGMKPDPFSTSPASPRQGRAEQSYKGIPHNIAVRGGGAKSGLI